MYLWIANAIFMKQGHKSLRTQLTHKISRNPVVRLLKSPLECHHVTISGAAGITWCPRLSSHHICLLHIRSDVTWREAILHSQRIEERLDSRPHLAPSVHCHIIGEMHKVSTSDIRFDMAVLGTHAHESTTQERLVIADGVEWSHDGIPLALIGEDGHSRLFAERLQNLTLRNP